MPLIDFHAAQRIAEMRKDRGMSPEALADDIRAHSLREDWGTRGAADAHTIRRIERYGHVPGERVAFVMASYFGLRPSELWMPANQRHAQQRVAA